jgi:hypothetical protein
MFVAEGAPSRPTNLALFVAGVSAPTVEDIGAGLGIVRAGFGATVATEGVSSCLANRASLIAGGGSGTDIAAGRGHAADESMATLVTERAPSRSMSGTSGVSATRSNAGRSTGGPCRNQHVRHKRSDFA